MVHLDRKSKRLRLASKPDHGAGNPAMPDAPKFRTVWDPSCRYQLQDLCNPSQSHLTYAHSRQEAIPDNRPESSGSTALSGIAPAAPTLDPLQDLQQKLKAHRKPPPPAEESDALASLQRRLAAVRALRAEQANHHPPLPQTDLHIPPPPHVIHKQHSSIKLSSNITLVGPIRPTSTSPIEPEHPTFVPHAAPPQLLPKPDLPASQSLKPVSTVLQPLPQVTSNPVLPTPKVPNRSGAKIKRRPKKAHSSSDDVDIVADIRPAPKPSLHVAPPTSGPARRHRTPGLSDSEEDTPLPAVLIKQEPRDAEIPHSRRRASPDVIDIVDSDAEHPRAGPSKQRSGRHCLSREYRKNPNFAPRHVATPPAHIITQEKDILLRGHRREDLVFEDIELAREFQNTLQVPVHFVSFTLVP